MTSNSNQMTPRTSSTAPTQRMMRAFARRSVGVHTRNILRRVPLGLGCGRPLDARMSPIVAEPNATTAKKISTRPPAISTPRSTCSCHPGLHPAILGSAERAEPDRHFREVPEEGLRLLHRADTAHD